MNKLWILIITLLLVWITSYAVDGALSFIRCVSSTLLGVSITLELMDS